jgi:hypothetical protein
MSAISSKSVNPPIACEGVSFGYPSGYVPAPQSGQLGHNTNIVSGANITPITGVSQNQIYYTAGVLGTGLPAGTYVAYSVANISNVVGSVNSFIEVVDAADGSTAITDSAGSYLGPSASVEQSAINIWNFTSSKAFMVYSRWRTAASGTNSGTPVDNGSLQIIRIA